MAVTIKLNNASGSDPSASDLVVGEVALRTDNAKLFTKKDDNSVAEIGATVSADAVDTNAIQDDAVTADKLAANAVVTGSIVNDAVTFAKQQNISTSRVLGRVSSSTGNVEELTAANIRTLINVADGATNVTNTNQLTNGAGFITATLTNEQVQDIVGGMVTGNTESGITVTYQDGDGTLDFSVASQTDENFTTTLKNKLDGIAASATNVTNNNQLTNGAGYITATLTNEQVQDIVGGMVTGNTESGITVTYQDSDGTLDFSVASQTDNNFTTTLKNKLDGIASGATNVTNNNQISNGAGYITSADGGNAATLDSLDSTAFLRSNAADTASELITLTGGLAFGGDAKCSAAISSLSDGSTITVNFTSGIHHSVTLGGNRTFGNPSNDNNAVGQSGSIFITQDGTGSRTASFHSDYKFAGGTAPTLSTAANAVDRLDYVIKASGVIHCVVTLDVK